MSLSDLQTVAFWALKNATKIAEIETSIVATQKESPAKVAWALLFFCPLPLNPENLLGELVRKKYFLRSPEQVTISYLVSGFLIMIFDGLIFGFLMTGSIVKVIFAWALTGLPILGFAKSMPAKTSAGSSAYMDILGFREFMNRAEKDRLERMGDRNLFSKFLPYAISSKVIISQMALDIYYWYFYDLTSVGEMVSHFDTNGGGYEFQ